MSLAVHDCAGSAECVAVASVVGGDSVLPDVIPVVDGGPGPRQVNAALGISSTAAVRGLKEKTAWSGSSGQQQVVRIGSPVASVYEGAAVSLGTSAGGSAGSSLAEGHLITSSDSVSGNTAEPGHCKVNTVQTAAACTLPVSTLGTGALVVVSGLRERPEFNGVRGLIVGGLTTTGRWPVRLEGMEVAVAIRGCHLACISRTVQPQAHGRGCTPSSSVHSTAELGRDPRWMWKADGYESRVREHCGSAANLGLRQLDARASDSASPSGCSCVGCGMPCSGVFV